MGKVLFALLISIILSEAVFAKLYLEGNLETRVNGSSIAADNIENTLGIAVSGDIGNGHSLYFATDASRRSLNDTKRIAIDTVEIGYNFFKEIEQFQSSVGFTFYTQAQTNDALKSIINAKGSIGFNSYLEKNFYDFYTLSSEFNSSYYLSLDPLLQGLISDLYYDLKLGYSLSDQVQLDVALKQYIEFYTDFDYYGSYLSVVPTIHYQINKGPKISLYLNYLLHSNSLAEFLYTNYGKNATLGFNISW